MCVTQYAVPPVENDGGVPFPLTADVFQLLKISVTVPKHCTVCVAGIWNVMVEPALAFAALIASRSVQLFASHAPSSVSAALLTVSVRAPTVIGTARRLFVSSLSEIWLPLS